MSPMRWRLTLILALSAFVLLGGSAGAVDASPPVVQAKSAILVDSLSGAVLFQQGAHDRRPIASTTKVMTALVALESSRLDETVVATERCTKVEGSCLALKPGERVKLDDLLTALMLKSANDAAVAIAEHVGGTVDGFVARMNRRAQELGAKDSHFANPNGLFDPEHYSSAYDLALITREAMKHPRFRELVSTKVADIYRPDIDLKERMINHNKLLWRDDTIDGVKTGWVRQSGQCLVASATRADWQLISVVLDSPDVYGDSEQLMDYGFATFQQEIFAHPGEKVGEARVAYGDARSVPAVAEFGLGTVLGDGLPGGAHLETIYRKLYAPVKAGQTVGEAKLVRVHEVLAETRLVAQRAVPKSWLLFCAIWTFRTVGALTIAAVLVRTNAKAIKTYRRRRRRLPSQSRRPDPGGAGLR